jgi:L-alanine-DL-glutamate epimerase-like enolase superfamily enzyme
MRIKEIRECPIPLSRYADPTIPSGDLTTSLVAVTTDVIRDGKPVIGYGYSSVGRYAQGGLIRERFAPRLLSAGDGELADDTGTNLDPLRAWAKMLAGEKPGGHGERCVAVGTLDMAIWDAAAKIAGLPLCDFIVSRLRLNSPKPARIRVYAGGGYRYPQDDVARLADEMRQLANLGFTHAKIKIGGAGLDQDRRRIEAAAAQLGGSERLAVDAMNAYDAETGIEAASMLRDLDLWWFEDVCDPLDFATQASIAAAYPQPIAAGEALFSLAEAKLLHRHGGLRQDRDVLVFDPVHCYGLPGFLHIVEYLGGQGWRRESFWPHGGHLFGLHVVAALGLGGAELNPFAFRPFRGLAENMSIVDGQVGLPEAPGIGYETHAEVYAALRAAFGPGS